MAVDLTSMTFSRPTPAPSQGMSSAADPLSGVTFTRPTAAPAIGLGSFTPQAREPEKQSNWWGAAKSTFFDTMGAVSGFPGLVGGLIPGEDIFEDVEETTRSYWDRVAEQDEDVQAFQKSMQEGTESFASTALGSAGPTAAAIGMSMIPVVGTPLAVSFFYKLNENEVYEMAKSKGADEETAKRTAVVGGLINSALDFLPVGMVGRVLKGKNIPFAKTLAEKGLKHPFLKFFLGLGTTAAAEGGTEGLQGVVAEMAAERAANPNEEVGTFLDRMWEERDKLAGIFRENAELGMALGGVFGGAAATYNLHRSRQAEKAASAEQRRIEAETAEALRKEQELLTAESARKATPATTAEIIDALRKENPEFQKIEVEVRRLGANLQIQTGFLEKARARGAVTPSLERAIEKKKQELETAQQTRDRFITEMREEFRQSELAKLEKQREAQRLANIADQRAETEKLLEQQEPFAGPTGPEKSAAPSLEGYIETEETPVAPTVEQPKLEFIGMQESPEGEYPMFNIMSGPDAGSTVSADELIERGIPVPEIPGQPAAPVVAQEAAIDESQTPLSVADETQAPAGEVNYRLAKTGMEKKGTIVSDEGDSFIVKDSQDGRQYMVKKELVQGVKTESKISPEAQEKIDAAKLLEEARQYAKNKYGTAPKKKKIQDAVSKAMSLEDEAGQVEQQIDALDQFADRNGEISKEELSEALGAPFHKNATYKQALKGLIARAQEIEESLSEAEQEVELSSDEPVPFDDYLDPETAQMEEDRYWIMEETDQFSLARMTPEEIKRSIEEKRAIKEDELINGITRAEAGRMVANGDPAVLPHIEKGIQEGKHDILQMQDAIRNQMMREMARVKDPSARQRMMLNYRRIKDNLDRVLSGEAISNDEVSFAIEEGRLPDAGEMNSVEAIEEAVAPIRNGIPGGPSIVVLKDESQLPLSISNTKKRIDPNNRRRIRGVRHKGTIYLIAKNQEGPLGVQTTILHELQHYGLDAFGDAKNSILDFVFEYYGAEGLADVAGLYNLDLSRIRDQRRAADEKLAQVAEQGTDQTFLQKVSAMVRELLRGIGFKIEMNDNDILDLIRKAREVSTQGKAPGTPEWAQRLRDATKIFVLDSLGRPQFMYAPQEAASVFLRSAGWTEERIKAEIQRAEYPGGKTKAVMAWIDPNDFVQATTPNQGYAEMIQEEAGTISLPKIRRERQTPFLFVSRETNQIKAHEGRHRMSALAKAGAKAVPIVVDFQEPISVDELESSPRELELQGQRFDAKMEQGNSLYAVGMIPLAKKNIGRLLGIMGQTDAQFQLAFHGTPHIFPPEPGFPHGRPRLDKIFAKETVGEGGWAYGAGFYMAKEEALGKAYWKNLTRQDAEFVLKGLSEEDAKKIYNELSKSGYDIPTEEEAKECGGFGPMLYEEVAAGGNSTFVDILDAADTLGIKIKEKGEGSLYALDIPDDVMPKLLDWDKPLSEQSEHVKKAIGVIAESEITVSKGAKGGFSADSVFVDGGGKRVTIYPQERGSKLNVLSVDGKLNRTAVDLDQAETVAKKWLMGAGKTGEDFYNQLINENQKNGTAQKISREKAEIKASQYLASIGIPGNTHDGISKGATGAKYVIWDQKVLDRIALLKRNGEALDAMREAQEDDIQFSFAQDIGVSLAKAQKKITDNPNFVKWFGKSKVVDENGGPLVVYHGTDSDFNVFKKTSDIGFHFGTKLAAQQRMYKTGVASVEVIDRRPPPAARLTNKYRDIKVRNDAKDNREYLISLLYRKLAYPKLDIEKQVSEMQGKEVSDLVEYYEKIPDHENYFNRISLVDNAKTPFVVELNGEEKKSFKTAREADAYANRLAEDVVKPGGYYLSIKNPFRIKDLGTWNVLEIADFSGLSDAEKKDISSEGNLFNKYDKLKKILTQKGYDGFVYKNQVEDIGSDSYIAFSPTQIKSIFNRGTFDPENADIQFSLFSPVNYGPVDKLFGKPTKTPRQMVVGSWQGIKQKDIQNKAKTRLADRLNPIRVYLGESVYRHARVETGVSATLSQLLTNGKLKLNADGYFYVDTADEGFIPWLKKNGGAKMLAWIAAYRAENEAGGEAYLDAAKRQQIYQWVGADANDKEMHRRAKEFMEYQNSVLGFSVQAGVINQQERQSWEREIYLPFYRVLEDADARLNWQNRWVDGIPRSRLFLSAQIKKYKGADLPLGDPLENIIRNWTHLISESMRNITRAEAFDVGVQKGLWKELAFKDMHIFRKGTGKNKRMTFVSKKNGQENIISFLREGKPVYFQVEDEDLFNAFTNMNAVKMDGLIKRFLSVPKKVLTYSATFGPAFQVANMMRDSLQTWLLEPVFKPWDSAIGFIKAMTESKDYQMLMASGFGFGTSYVRGDDPEAVSNFIKHVIRKEKRSILLDTPAKMLGFWEKIGAAAESAARVQLYSKLKKKGLSHGEAAFRARDILDFSMRGDAKALQVACQTIPFLNARIQGMNKLARVAFGSDKQVKANFYARATMLAMLSLWLWHLNRDREEYQNLQEYDRNNYFHFWVPWIDGETHHVRIPKPFEVGAIFSTLPEVMAQSFAGHETYRHLGDTVLQILNDTFQVTPPQVIAPLLEQWANVNLFTDRPIVPEYLERKQPSAQYDPYTSDTLRLLGEKMNLSPMRVEHLLNGYFSTIAQAVLTVADTFIGRPMGDYPLKPEGRIEDLPLVGRFVRESSKLPARYTKYGTRFYDFANEVDKLIATINHYKGLGDMEKVRELMDTEKERKMVALSPSIRKIRQQMREINTGIRMAWQAKGMSPQAKAQTIDRYTKVKNRLQKQTYQIISNIMEGT